MAQKFRFLCGNVENINYIYAIKHSVYPWHYFEEMDSKFSSHGSSPQALDSLIGALNYMKTIEAQLDEAQSRNYFVDGKFIFNKKELKTCKHF